MRQKNPTDVKSLGAMAGKRLMFALEHGFLRGEKKKTRKEKNEKRFLLEILLILVLDSY